MERDMSRDKIKIAESSVGNPSWVSLMPIVEFCLERGCKLSGLTVEKPFYIGRDGGAQCHIIGPVTIDDILNEFVLPEHFEVGKPYANGVYDSKNRVEMSFTSFEKHEAAQKRSVKRKAEFEKRSAARKAKREMFRDKSSQ